MSNSEYRKLIGNKHPVEVAATLSNTINDHYFDLGMVLYFIKETGEYKQINDKKYFCDKHQKWKDFCENELTISYRSAQYYLTMYQYFDSMGVTKEQLRGLGWSKAKELVGLTEDAETLLKAIDYAKDHNLNEVKAFVEESSETFSETTETTMKVVKFNFKLYEASAEFVQKALQFKAAELGTDDLNSAFELIMIEWLRSQDEGDLDNMLDSELESEGRADILGDMKGTYEPDF